MVAKDTREAVRTRPVLDAMGKRGGVLEFKIKGVGGKADLLMEDSGRIVSWSTDLPMEVR